MRFKRISLLIVAVRSKTAQNVLIASGLFAQRLRGLYLPLVKMLPDQPDGNIGRKVFNQHFEWKSKAISHDQSD
jgi:hypothetical protein